MPPWLISGHLYLGQGFSLGLYLGAHEYPVGRKSCSVACSF